MVHMGEGSFASNNVRERLDRGVATGRWFDVFPNYKVHHLSCFVSDHCPLLLDTTVAVQKNRRARLVSAFKFEVEWSSEKSCEETIFSLWQEAHHLTVPDRLEFLGKG